MKCIDCVHWEPSKFNAHCLPEDHTGICSEIENKIDIDLQAGLDGALIRQIETGCNFYCAAFEPK